MSINKFETRFFMLTSLQNIDTHTIKNVSSNGDFEIINKSSGETYLVEIKASGTKGGVTWVATNLFVKSLEQLSENKGIFKHKISYLTAKPKTAKGKPKENHNILMNLNNSIKVEKLCVNSKKIIEEHHGILVMVYTEDGNKNYSTIIKELKKEISEEFLSKKIKFNDELFLTLENISLRDFSNSIIMDRTTLSIMSKEISSLNFSKITRFGFELFSQIISKEELEEAILELSSDDYDLIDERRGVDIQEFYNYLLSEHELTRAKALIIIYLGEEKNED